MTPTLSRGGARSIEGHPVARPPRVPRAVALVELQIAHDDWTDALAAHEPQAASEAFSRWWTALRQLQEAG